MHNVIAVGKALSDVNRVRTLMALQAYHELCACQIADFLQITAATVSRHMGVLQLAGLVDGRKDGRWVYYRLSEKIAQEPHLANVLHWMFFDLDADPIIHNDRRLLAEITRYDAREVCQKKYR
jgi:ArsR family transcriptional regulator